MKCPTCSQEWANPDVYARLKAWRGTMTITDAAVVCRVGRITYGRIEAGVRTSWPEWWAVMSAAGIGQSEALAAWSATPGQTGTTGLMLNGKRVKDILPQDHVMQEAPGAQDDHVRVDAPVPDSAGRPARGEAHGEGLDVVDARPGPSTRDSNQAAPDKVVHRNEPDGEKCGRNYELIGGKTRFRGYCDRQKDHFPSEGDLQTGHHWVKGVKE